ncbi:sulfite exporter TauE/SafE family protein, partial [Pseudomonas gingeri]|nr:sulfite exporter TauE/SafE family protein [Pseudomonas gingeri]
MIEWIEYLVLGIVMGGVGGIFGIGGGMIAIPVLGILFGLDQQLAQGTALVMVVPNVVLALHRYNQRNRIELRHALPLVLMSFCFAWFGALWAVGLDPRSMRLGFVGFLLVLALFYLVRLFMAQSPVSAHMRYPWPWLGVLGAASGT